jgi:hypothetical protein
MVSTTATKSQTRPTSYELTQATLVKWGAFMFSIYVMYLLVFPLIPTIHQSDHVLEIEQMLCDGRKWFASLYTLRLGMLFFPNGPLWEDWGLTGPLQAYWKFWTIMTLITVPWVFGIPILGPLLLRWKDRRRFH